MRHSLCAPICRAAVISLILPLIALPQTKPRGRDLGIPLEGAPGPLNAITDVKGVEVGHSTIISGRGNTQDRERAGENRSHGCPAAAAGALPTWSLLAWFSQNGAGEMTGTTWIEESGFLDGPVMITNTHSVGIVRDAIIAWRVRNNQLAQAFYLAGRRGNLRRLFERCKRLSCERKARLRGARWRSFGSRRGRQCRWRNRNDLPWIQGRYRNFIAATR